MTDAIPSRRIGHVPVLLNEVLTALSPRDGALYVDATFGAGGYSRALLERAECAIYAIDRDPRAVAGGAELVAAFAARLTLLAGRFGDIEALLGAHGVRRIDGGIMLDLGASSAQIDDPARGFSFRADGPLDMRMEGVGPSAADLVNEAGEAELAALIRRYGEERRARQVARAIVAARRRRPITRTGDLAELVRAVVPRSPGGIDPATRTFQALRIHVNDELGELARGLGAGERLLAAGARLVVVSFHSLEDRLVKRFLRRRSAAAPRPTRHQPPPPARRAPSFRLLTTRPIRPKAEEVAAAPARPAISRRHRRVARRPSVC